MFKRAYYKNSNNASNLSDRWKLPPCHSNLIPATGDFQGICSVIESRLLLSSEHRGSRQISLPVTQQQSVAIPGCVIALEPYSAVHLSWAVVMAIDVQSNRCILLWCKTVPWLICARNYFLVLIKPEGAKTVLKREHVLPETKVSKETVLTFNMNQ